MDLLLEIFYLKSAIAKPCTAFLVASRFSGKAKRQEQSAKRQ